MLRNCVFIIVSGIEGWTVYSFHRFSNCQSDCNH